MKAIIMAVIAAMSIATAFAQEQQADSCKQSGLNFITKQEYERMARFRREYPFFPSKDVEVIIIGGSLVLKTDSGNKKLEGDFYEGEYLGFYTYVGYISVSGMYVCEDHQLHYQDVLLVNRKNGDITRLYAFAFFDEYGTRVITYDLNREGISGGVIKVYEYIDDEYTCVKEIRSENWCPAGVYFYDDKVIGKIEYFDNDRVDYFWISV